MEISITKHGLERLYERSGMDSSDIKQIVTEEKYVRIGHDLNKKNVCHWLTFNKLENEFFILVIDELKMDLITILFAEDFKNWVIDPAVFDSVKRGDFKLEDKTNKKKHIKQHFESIFQSNQKIRKINNFCSKKEFKENFKEDFNLINSDKEWTELYTLYQKKHYPVIFGYIRQDLQNHAEEIGIHPGDLSFSQFSDIIDVIRHKYKFYISSKNKYFYDLCIGRLKKNKKGRFKPL